MQDLKEAKLNNQIVLVREDYNVPMKDGKIADDSKILASLPTLKYLRENGAKKIIVISHLGRPEKKDKTLSLKPIAETLNKYLGNVSFIDDVSGPDVENAVKKLKKGDILVLENLRFYPGEEKNSDDFISEIIDSTSAQIYIQDGFAVLHRAHASTVAVANHLPVYSGILLEKELNSLKKVLAKPEHPVLLIIGGAKVDDKAPLIEKLSDLSDNIFVGGKIAADGFKSDSKKVYVAEDFDEDATGAKLDIGPVSAMKLSEMISISKTIIWNGLLGKAEDPAYETSSELTAQLIGKKQDATTIICGGDTTAYVKKIQSKNSDLAYTLISTGGGATLEYLINESLPGLNIHSMI